MMSNRQSRAKKRALKNKILVVTQNEKKSIFYKLIYWLKKRISRLRINYTFTDINYDYIKLIDYHENVYY